MSDLSVDRRLSKVEEDIGGLGKAVASQGRDLAIQGQAIRDIKDDIGAVGRSFDTFQKNWAATKEEERRAQAATRMTPLSLIAMLAAITTMLGAILGGNLYMINTQVNAVRTDVTAQVAKDLSSVDAQIARLEEWRRAAERRLEVLERRLEAPGR